MPTTTSASNPPAKYKCQACHHEWDGKPGPVRCPQPKCGHIFVDWLNYWDWDWLEGRDFTPEEKAEYHKIVQSLFKPVDTE
jgi:hypothetical protein